MCVRRPSNPAARACGSAWMGRGFESPLPGRHGVMNHSGWPRGSARFSHRAGAPGRSRARSSRPENARRTVHARRHDDSGRLLQLESRGGPLDAGLAWATPARAAYRRAGRDAANSVAGPSNLHRDLGVYAVECGIDVLVGIRGAARYMVDAARGLACRPAPRTFSTIRIRRASSLQDVVRPGDAMLFKGSRGTHVEWALEKFLALNHALLAPLRTALPLLQPAPRVPVHYVSDGVREPYRAVPFAWCWGRG